MAEIFVDTSGWASYFVERESFHRQSSRILRAALAREVRLITTNYVLMELAALLVSPLKVKGDARIQILDEIRSANWLKILFVSRTSDEEAWNLLKARPDKDWSLADCSNFVVMRSRGIAEALTNDRHFEQAGFVRLLT